MSVKNLVQRAQSLCGSFRVNHGKRFKLKDHDPGETLGLSSQDKPRAAEALHMGVETLARLQDMLYAQDRWAVLLIFQGMDAAGKDSAIKHVMSGINPQGCDVHSFKAPSSEDLDHDYLWRCTRRLPERGRIGIFNRSYYEETLIVRVHRELLPAEKIPRELITGDIWSQRFQDIRRFERYLAHNGVVVRKFFLHVSKQEQRKRLIARLDDPHKRWKFSPTDLKEHQHWKEYMHAYEQTIRHTATRHAPWYVVPADNKWFTRLVVAAAVIDALASLKLSYPRLSRGEMAELMAAKRAFLDGRKR